jgi:hypothetical protein
MNDCCFRPRFCTDEAILGRGTTWVNEVIFVMKHTPHTGSITQFGRSEAQHITKIEKRQKRVAGSSHDS